MNKTDHHINGVITVVESFLQSLKDRKQRPATITIRRQSLKKFLAFLGENRIDRIQDVTLEYLDRFRHHLTSTGNLVHNTVEQHMRGVRLFFDYLEDHSLLFENPARNLVLHKKHQALPLVISLDDVRRLLKAPDCSRPAGLRDRTILEVLYATGMRREEILSLRVFDIDFDQQTVRVNGKGQKERLLPLGKHAAFYLREYIRTVRPKLTADCQSLTDQLWIGSYKQPLSVQMVSVIVRKYARKAGIKSIGPHTLRRSCATHMLQQGAHPLFVAQLLGHADLKTLSHYLRVTITDIKKMHSGTKPGR